MVKGISNPDNIIEDPAAFTRELAFAFLAQKNIIDILFSGSREYKLADQIEQSIRTLESVGQIVNIPVVQIESCLANFSFLGEFPDCDLLDLFF